ncbi:MAG TPA: sigma 54-interacting transcriptional regulator [Terriglobales bacterium]|nr:sigma 54-interacting transcriptional regulator [Terriglobales bacterium]
MLPDRRCAHPHQEEHHRRDSAFARSDVAPDEAVTATNINDLKPREPKLRPDLDEEELRQIVDLIPQHIVVLDSSGTAIFANQQVLEYTGLSLDQVRAGNFRERAFHPEDVERLGEERQKALCGTAPFENEQRVLGKDGKYRWFLIRYNPLLDESRKAVRWYCAATEITERKQAEENLRRVIDTIPTLAWSNLPDGTNEFLNKNWHEYTGLSPEESHGWGWQIAFYPEDLPPLMEKWKGMLVSGEPGEIEARLRRHDGVYRWFLIRAEPFRDEAGMIIRWYGTSTDIDDRKRAEEELRAAMSERARLAAVRAEIGMALARKDNLKVILDLCARALVRHLDAAFVRIWTLNGNGRELELQASAGIYTRLDGRYGRIPFGKFKIGSIAQSRQPHVTNDVQNDPRVDNHEWARTQKMTSFAGYPLVVEDRVVGVMGMFSRKALNRVTIDTLSFIADGIAQSIERKHAEDALQRSELYLAEGQRLGHTGSWALNLSGFFEHWSRELFQMYGLDAQKGAPTVEQYLATVHPQDRDFMVETIKRMHEQSCGCDVKKRIIRPDGAVRIIRCVGIPVLDNGVLKRFLGTAMDVTEQEELTQELQRREAYLVEAQRLSHTGSFGWKPESGEIVWSDETYRIFEYDRAVKPTIDSVAQRVHPEDRAAFHKVIEDASGGATHFEHGYRLLLPDGRIKHVYAIAQAIEDTSGNREFVGAGTDVTSIKRAEEELRHREAELRQVLDLTPQQVAVFGSWAREGLYANRILLDYLGLTLQEWRQCSDRSQYLHPDDRERFDGVVDRILSHGVTDELELRLRKADGTYRWFLSRFNPLRDEQGRITRWYIASTDIEERKQAEERTRNENLALREQIDRDSMFEDIVGSSEALRKVLRQIAKVAPSDSTVLILGETGTGKELVARAIHKRSHRSDRAFIGVNCAAIPPSLIASELFGHEKGAFTGATQRRLGRFESANGGTIFLDEVGDLPPEIQIALLRALQEREIERVGSNRAIPVDVRVLAATHHDLDTLVAEGKFRQDLLYRLRVVPIRMPSLRERADDISVLVDYFIGRFGKKTGKKFRTIDKRTIELFEAYPWPGNVRELQNVIERAVILSEGDIFCVDETWLNRQAPQFAGPPVALTNALQRQEKEMIEAALAESGGRVSGRDGAAIKLGLPRPTLDAKIKRLGIDKYQFKRQPSP